MRNSLGLLPLLANAGVPMIFLTLPAMLMLLIPIIIVEGILFRKWLGLTTREAMEASTVSNLASTVFGVPVAWAIMLEVEFVTLSVVGQNQAIQNWHSPIAKVIFFFFSSAWIGPPNSRNVWVIPAATLVLLVPFFFASYGIEYRIIRKMVGLPEGDPLNLGYPRVRIAVRNANLITYGAMFLACAAWLAIVLPHH